MALGKLYLVPVPLGEGGEDGLPAGVSAVLGRLRHLIAEQPKTARRWLKALKLSRPLDSWEIRRLNKHTPPAEWNRYLDPALQGEDVGLLSEAGCPGVADPGADIVGLAHRLGIEVVPLVGPSSILLALMASGLNGQQFCFHGYLPRERQALSRTLKALEREALREGRTQLFIETPYRNAPLFQALLRTLSPTTRLCVAVNLTLPNQWVRTRSVAEWKKQPPPPLEKQPAVFLFGV
ncbi:MAG: SAM-dependent methyltransferase [Bacteroidetes bacterium]|nr:MAG: SAM-dependent methyltransferase [Bacteroidota bacterium]